MKLEERIDIVVYLGEQMIPSNEKLDALVQLSYHHNNWFTAENYWAAIDAIKETMLSREALEAWLADYTIPVKPSKKKVGLVMAGNIPLVGFHDILCVFLSGHQAQIKLSDKDKSVLPYLIEIMKGKDSRVADYFEIVEKIGGFDKVIATGSDNTARYFQQYFGKYPHIIRKNRQSIAVLNGNETPEELHRLGKDIFQYFGLGCRNVAKVLVPKDYNFEPFMEALHAYRDLVLHHKYKNNFDYNFTLLVLNSKPYFSNGCLLVHKDELLQSRIASIHYEEYRNLAELDTLLTKHEDSLQCIVSQDTIQGWETFPLGGAQTPSLSDYADGVDTMKFLLG